MPEKFDLNYVDEKNEKRRPVVIHRAICGSMDRFIGILIEHFAGAFPVWLAPVQVEVMPVSAEAHQQYASSVEVKLNQAGIRVKLDSRNEKLGYKIREAQMKKIPYILVVGDKEAENGTVNIRKYAEDKPRALSIEEFIESLSSEIKNKQL
jgi:threonyl-tRNA synthetase